MSPKRRRVFLHDPAPLRCPHCNEDSPLEVASLLGTLNTAAAAIDGDVLKQLLIDTKERWCAGPFKDTTRHKILCASCSHPSAKVHWVVLGVDHVAGPWCIRCLRSLVWREMEGDKGLKQDLFVLGVSASILALRRLHNIHIDLEPTSPGDSGVVF